MSRTPTLRKTVWLSCNEDLGDLCKLNSHVLRTAYSGGPNSCHNDLNTTSPSIEDDIKKLRHLISMSFACPVDSFCFPTYKIHTSGNRQFLAPNPFPQAQVVEKVVKVPPLESTTHTATREVETEPRRQASALAVRCGRRGGRTGPSRKEGGALNVDASRR